MEPNISPSERAQQLAAWDAPSDPWQDFVPLDAEQAAKWRATHPTLSAWRIIAWQVLAGLSLAALLGLVSGRAVVAGSLAYGTLTVALPAAVFARGLLGPLSSINAKMGYLGFVLWELVKLALTLVMLLSAPRLVPSLNWPALLVGLVFALLVYWVALRIELKARVLTTTD